MPFTLAAEMEEGFVRLVLSGSMDEYGHEDLFQQLQAIYNRSPFHAVLADERNMISSLSITALYQSAQTAAAMFPPGMRVAILLQEGREEFAEFSETASANRGILLKHFVKEDEAIAWLTEDV